MGICIWQLLIILLIVLLLFGAKKLRGLGGDLGGAVKGFRDAMQDQKHDDNDDEEPEKLEHSASKRVIDSEAAPKEKDKAQS